MAYDPLAAFRMDGHATLVTGGAQNIGAGIARAFAGAGARVMIADLDGAKAEATAQAIAAETGREVHGIACDVTREEDVAACAAATAAAFGGISTLVNNVGWGGVHPDPLAVTAQQMLDSYRLNTVSAYLMTAACLPHLRRAANASVINSGSFSSVMPAAEILAYATAKAALNQLMVSLAHALAKSVRVNSVLIGTVITEGYAAAGIDASTQERMQHPDTLTGRPGSPADVANAMLWLASPAGGWVSGQTINVHGGGSVVRLFGH